MQFCLGVIQKLATGCHSNGTDSLIFSCNFSVTNVYFFLSILLLSQNMDSWDSDLSNDMYFVKILKSFDSKSKFCKMTPQNILKYHFHVKAVRLKKKSFHRINFEVLCFWMINNLWWLLKHVIGKNEMKKNSCDRSELLLWCSVYFEVHSCNKWIYYCSYIICYKNSDKIYI